MGSAAHSFLLNDRATDEPLWNGGKTHSRSKIIIFLIYSTTFKLSYIIQCLSFGPEPSVFSVAVEKLKNWNIHDYNFACGSVWV
jgi:hypothetical protein